MRELEYIYIYIWLRVNMYSPIHTLNPQADPYPDPYQNAGDPDRSRPRIHQIIPRNHQIIPKNHHKKGKHITVKGRKQTLGKKKKEKHI